MQNHDIPAKVKMTHINQHSGRFLYAFWLALLPIVDVVLVGVFPPQIRAEGVTAVLLIYAFTILGTLIFWVGAFLLAQQVLSRVEDLRWRGMRLILRSGIRMFLCGFHLYFLLLWIYIVASGHPPNPEAIVFLMDNMARVPQHLLQTSPLGAISVVAVSITAAMITESAIVSLSRGSSIGRKWKVVLAAMTSLVASHLMAPLGLSWSPVAFAIAGDVEERVDARVNMIIGNLAQKKTVAVKEMPDRSFPVIVILVESLRYDLLKHHPDAIPFLKSLHDDNIGFDLSYATASHSNLTDLAFWHSQYPLRGAGKESYPVDAPWRGTSLFRAFKDSGYRTAYISSQNERWGNMINWLKTPDVDYFFDSENFDGETWENYDDLAGLGGMLKRGLVTAGKVEDSQTLAIARQWISSNSGSPGFFLGMNLQNTHFSYVMPPGGIEPYQPSELGFDAVYYRWPESKKDNVRNRYLNAVTNVDSLLEKFSQYLKQRGIWDECLFVVVGDNGEGFYEHGFGNHSGPMYDEAVRTFSVIKLPESLRKAPFRVTHPISHIDIAASIPFYAGIGVPESFQGLPIHISDQLPRPVYMYSNAIVRQFGIVSWPWKLLMTEYPETQEELYRLDTDPQESINLAPTSSSEKKKLSEALRLWINTQKAYYGSSAYGTKIPPQHISDQLRH